MRIAPGAWSGFARRYLSHAYMLYALQLACVTAWIYFIGAESFGLAAVYTGVITLPINVMEAGLLAVIYSPKEVGANQLNRIGLQQLLLGIGLAILVCTVAQPLTGYLGEQRLYWLFICAALSLPLIGLGRLRQKYIYRHHDAVSLSNTWWLKLASRYGVAIVLYIVTDDVRALAFGAFASQLVEALCFLLMRGDLWRPQLASMQRPDVTLTKQRLYAAGESVVTTVLEQGDTIFMARILDPVVYGIYAYLRRLLISAVALCTGPVTAVILPLYRTEGGNNGVYRRHTQLNTFLLGPALVGGAVVVLLILRLNGLDDSPSVVTFIVPVSCWAALSLQVYANINFGYGINRISRLGIGSMLAAMLIVLAFASVLWFGFSWGAVLIAAGIFIGSSLQQAILGISLQGSSFRNAVSNYSLGVSVVLITMLRWEEAPVEICLLWLGLFGLAWAALSWGQVTGLIKLAKLPSLASDNA